MTPDDTVRGSNGHAGRSPWDRREDQGRQLARLTAQQLRRAPGVPASGARFLAAHAVWILAVTIVAVGAAGLMVFSQTPLYSSQAAVVVNPPVAAAGSGSPVNMATEEDIATSGAVLAMASRKLHVPADALASGLSVHVPGTTTLLQIAYSDPVPRIAQQRAQAIAQAYVTYRSAQSAAASGKNSAKSGPVSVTPTAALVTSASLPSSPSSPNYLIDIGAALIVGLALAIGTAALRDHLDDRLRGPLDLEAQAAAPVLALIPAFRPGLRDRGRRLPVVEEPGSVVAEAYRGLRTRVVQEATSRNAKTVLVTCPGWEDKSTVAANLAAALAQSGRDVALVCADLRWGQAHELFRGGNGDGLRGLLEGRTSLEGALQATQVPGLWLLPPGVTPADPAALLERPAWRTALADIRTRADVVIIEAPPILTCPDARPLADLAETMLIVTDARRTTRAQLRVTVHEIEPVHGKLAGCVLANVGRRRRLRSPEVEPVADRFGGAARATDASQGAVVGQGVTPANENDGSRPFDAAATEPLDPATLAPPGLVHFQPPSPPPANVQRPDSPSPLIED
jgi:polysaccharide biosynthesis transport protein